MFAATRLPPMPPLQRTRGRAEVAVHRRGRATRLARLHQSGAAKALMPNSYGPVPEAVLLNTAGGLTGGDRLDWAIAVGPGATLTVTTQAAERLYRSTGPEARVATRLALAPGATLNWLPQETILFDAARLRRSLAVEMAADARLLALETLVLGRRAMGESLATGYLNDQWRIRRGDRLVYADALRADGGLAALFAAPATLSGARALTTLVYAAPDAEDRRDAARALVATLADVEAAASAWDGLLVVRLLAAEAHHLRAALATFLAAFAGPLPRVWSL